jgi:hypothetical protein
MRKKIHGHMVQVCHCREQTRYFYTHVHHGWMDRGGGGFTRNTSQNKCTNFKRTRQTDAIIPQQCAHCLHHQDTQARYTTVSSETRYVSNRVSSHVKAVANCYEEFMQIIPILFYCKIYYVTTDRAHIVNATPHPVNGNCG